MTDPSKRYWITKQRIREAAAEYLKEAHPDLMVSMVEELAQIILAHSEAASTPEVGRCPICGSGDPKVFLGKCAVYYSRREPAHIFHWESTSDCLRAKMRFEAAAPPQGTPAPEPDRCPQCRSTERKLLGEKCQHKPYDPIHKKPHPWHSTVAAQKEEP